jgi:hypothetical protein
MTFLCWLGVALLWVAVLAVIGRITARPPAPRLTGVYVGGATIIPHDLTPPQMVGARVAKRLNCGDRVEFEVSPRNGQARAVRVYRRHEH